MLMLFSQGEAKVRCLPLGGWITSSKFHHKCPASVFLLSFSYFLIKDYLYICVFCVLITEIQKYHFSFQGGNVTCLLSRRDSTVTEVTEIFRREPAAEESNSWDGSWVFCPSVWRKRVEDHGNDRLLSVVNCSERTEETYSHILIMNSITRKSI